MQLVHKFFNKSSKRARFYAPHETFRRLELLLPTEEWKNKTKQCANLNRLLHKWVVFANENISVLWEKARKWIENDFL